MGKLEEHESCQTQHIFLLMWRVVKVSSRCWLKSQKWALAYFWSSFPLSNLATLAGKNTESA